MKARIERDVHLAGRPNLHAAAQAFALHLGGLRGAVASITNGELSDGELSDIRKRGEHLRAEMSRLAALPGQPSTDVLQAWKNHSDELSRLAAVLDEQAQPSDAALQRWTTNATWIERMIVASYPEIVRQKMRHPREPPFEITPEALPDDVDMTKHLTEIATIDRPCRPFGDDFYEQIAEAYRNLVPYTHAPAALLADTNHVPIKTARRWIATARKRGLLQPGRNGAAG